MQTIKIGTRGSKLALWQANYIAELLQQGGLKTEIITIDTTGDKMLDVSIAKIGSKGVFTEEIEEQLAQSSIDIAVHSAKDMQSVIPDRFELLAFTEREQANDVILSNKNNISLQDNIVLGTSSTRRIALLKKIYPHIKTVPVRGNLQTRIKRMKEGACDALMLAYAGVHRMGYEDMIAHILPTNEFIPAVGQGCIAIECCTDLDAVRKSQVRELTNHRSTEIQLLAERAYLRELEGGCSIPVFALARLGADEVSLTGGIISLDGKRIIKATEKGSITRSEEVGKALAEYVLSNGGAEILRKIKEQINK